MNNVINNVDASQAIAKLMPGMARSPKEAEFVRAMITHATKWVRPLQAKWIGDILQANGHDRCGMPLDINQANNAPKAPIAPKADVMTHCGNKLGEGAFREGFEVKWTKDLIIKRPHTFGSGLKHCQFEAELFRNAGKHSAVLAPCFMNGNRLFMFRVDNYVNTGTFQPSGRGEYVHSENGKTITRENYDALMLACEELRNFEGNPFWDCKPNRRTQGGWIGSRFVMTDYAL